MRPIVHKLYLFSMAIIVFLTLVYFLYWGFTYYVLSVEERFFHEQHQLLKPSGLFGHGLGIIGSLLMIVGVGMYMLRKRVRKLGRLGILKHWLEFHIFLCTLGPLLVLFHTAFKFGGIVSVSFWSMVAVVISGVIGRYIYLQIPRSIEGRELSLQEIDSQKSELNKEIRDQYKIEEEAIHTILSAIKSRPDRSGKNMFVRFLAKYKFEVHVLAQIKRQLKSQQLSKSNYKEVMKLIRSEISMNRKIDRLLSMQKIFRYWHVVHLPFALIMLIIMLIHIGVTLTFGYKWIF